MRDQTPVQTEGPMIQRGHTPSRVLVIAPDADVRWVLEVFVTMEGCEVQTASDEVTGLALAQQWQPDLILLDLDGLPTTPPSFILAYQQLDGPEAPVIVFSREELNLDQVAELGAAGWLSNPFALHGLLELLAQFAPCDEP